MSTRVPIGRTESRRRPIQRRSELTVEALVEAAAQVFERHGYAAGTTNRIAARAGVSIGTLYQYFSNKDELLLAVAERHVSEGSAVIGELLAWLDEDPPLEVAIPAFLKAMVELHLDRPRLHRILYEEAPVPDQLGALLVELQEFAARSLERYLERLGYEQPALAAWALAQAIEACTHRWVIHERERFAADEFVTGMSRFIAAGVRGSA